MSTITITHKTCDHCGRSELHGIRMASSVTRFWEPGAPTVDVCVDCAALGYIACNRCFQAHPRGVACKKVSIIEDEPVYLEKVPCQT